MISGLLATSVWSSASNGLTLAPSIVFISSRPKGGKRNVLLKISLAICAAFMLTSCMTAEQRLAEMEKQDDLACRAETNKWGLDYAECRDKRMRYRLASEVTEAQ